MHLMIRWTRPWALRRKDHWHLHRCSELKKKRKPNPEWICKIDKRPTILTAGNLKNAWFAVVDIFNFYKLKEAIYVHTTSLASWRSFPSSANTFVVRLSTPLFRFFECKLCLFRPRKNASCVYGNKYPDKGVALRMR